MHQDYAALREDIFFRITDIQDSVGGKFVWPCQAVTVERQHDQKEMVERMNSLEAENGLKNSSRRWMLRRS